MPKQSTSMLAARLMRRSASRRARCHVLDGPSAERGEAASRGADAKGTRPSQIAISKRNVVWFPDLIKLLYWDGSGLCLFSKRLEQGQFSWPAMQAAGQTVEIARTQLGMLLEGINWRMPERRWRPLRAG
jgi:hypothetical protein